MTEAEQIRLELTVTALEKRCEQPSLWQVLVTPGRPKFSEVPIHCMFFWLTRLNLGLDTADRDLQMCGIHCSWTHWKLVWIWNSIWKQFLWTRSPATSETNSLLCFNLALRVRFYTNCLLYIKKSISLCYSHSPSEATDAATSFTGSLFINFGGISQLNAANISRRN